MYYTSIPVLKIGRARHTIHYDRTGLLKLVCKLWSTTTTKHVNARFTKWKVWRLSSSVCGDVSRWDHVIQESFEQNKWSLQLECRDHMTSCPHWRQREASSVLLNIASSLHPSPRPKSKSSKWCMNLNMYSKYYLCLRRLMVYLAVRGVPRPPLFRDS